MKWIYTKPLGNNFTNDPETFIDIEMDYDIDFCIKNNDIIELRA